MFERLEMFRLAGALAEHAGQRQTVAAQNVAQADTPGYRALAVEDFASSYGGDARGDPFAMRATRPGHLGGDVPQDRGPRDRGAEPRLARRQHGLNRDRDGGRRAGAGRPRPGAGDLPQRAERAARQPGQEVSDMNDGLSIAASGMAAQSARMRLVSENIANADTPGYRRKTASFEAVMELGRPTGAVEPGRVRLDQRELERIHDPSHPLAGPDGSYEGSNVDLVVEIADAREAQRSFEANLKMFDQARQMTRSLMELLRR